MSEAILVGERRPLLVDGANPDPSAVITASTGSVQIDPADATGLVVVTALAEDTVDITVTEGAKSGTDSGIVIGAAVVSTPLTVTLGDPIP